MNQSWQPSASIETLRKRAALLHQIRVFFAQRKVLEVETPALSSHTITDPYLEAMHTLHTQGGAFTSSKLYLQTSPEYAMKRLLAAGSGDIFQLCKAFRDDEVGRIHNPEFTMLEWYRIGFSLQHLIDEVGSLLMATLKVEAVNQSSYSVLFERHLAFNPLKVDLPSLFEICAKLGLQDYVGSLRANLADDENTHASVLLKDSILQVLFSTHIESLIGIDYPTVVVDFPASQASLATLHENGRTANRFEVYYKGIELANGFDELTDAQSQHLRFAQDNQKRSVLGLSIKPIDMHFMAALFSGLPQCAGVALGVDRLLMLALQKNTIEEVMSFSQRNC